MNFVNMPIATFRPEYEPKEYATILKIESQMLVMACARFACPNVLEIGTQYGDATANMARVVKPLGGRVVTIDVTHSPKTIPHIQREDCRPKEEIGMNIPEDLMSCVTPVLIDPDNPNALDEALDWPGLEWDVVFVDGDHSYEGVKHDYLSIRNRVSNRGLILFHDVWWDVDPAPVDGPLRLMQKLGGVVLNLSHMGCLPEHINEIERRYL